ncbi:MAG: hypothetical protein KI790_03140 [Cyclobacteriaceae bacterium]|nr:hypothetical protein [Cyclobacteriaceae bacterium HetDA_MAG_MS6]
MKTLIFSLLAFNSIILWSQPILKQTKVTKEISMLLPSTFIAMTQQERIAKYVSSREPIAMYTNETRDIDLGINMNSSQWGQSDLDILQDFYKSSILNLYDEVNFLQEEIREVNGREFIVFEFTSKVVGSSLSFTNQATSGYTYIQYTLWNNRVLLFNFSCPYRYRSTWQPAAKEMMESVKIK